jgi:hypothetical protein
VPAFERSVQSYVGAGANKTSPADQLKAEDDNNNACIQYARENLGL